MCTVPSSILFQASSVVSRQPKNAVQHDTVKIRSNLALRWEVPFNLHDKFLWSVSLNLNAKVITVSFEYQRQYSQQIKAGPRVIL